MDLGAVDLEFFSGPLVIMETVLVTYYIIVLNVGPIEGPHMTSQYFLIQTFAVCHRLAGIPRTS